MYNYVQKANSVTVDLLILKTVIVSIAEHSADPSRKENAEKYDFLYKYYYLWKVDISNIELFD